MMKSRCFITGVWLAGLCLAAVLLSSCGDTSSESRSSGTVSHDGAFMSIRMVAPADVAALAIDGLQAEATVDGGAPHPLTVDPVTNAVRGTIAGVPVGERELRVTYFVSLSGTPVVLCTYATRVTVRAGESSGVTIRDEDLDREIDNDEDGYTNLAEVRRGTDPLSRLDFPGGGSPVVLVGSGVVETTASQNYIMKQTIGSAVAGRASSAGYDVIVSYIGSE